MATTILITFLGLPLRQQGEQGYVEATYRFEDNTEVRDTLFARALLSYLKAKRYEAPNRIVMLGTPTSAWRMFDPGQQAQEPETEESLDALRLDLAKWLGGPVIPLLTRAPRPNQDSRGAYALTTDEQMGLLHRIAGFLKPGDRVHLDVTHGLRHLPMLGLTCGRVAQALQGASTVAIWYGALELQRVHEGKAPVVRLDGLERAMRWSEALAAYDRSGDYRVFSDLLRQEGVADDVVAGLARAAFAELTLRTFDEAARALAPVIESLDGLPAGSVATLFRPRLRDRLSWTKQPTSSHRLYALAWQNLHRGDYVRAALCGDESASQRGVKLANRDLRQLRAVRNMLAHATDQPQGDHRDNERARNALRSEEELKTYLTSLLKRLAPPAVRQ